MTSFNTLQIIGQVAQTLGHGCALDAEEIETQGIISLEALDLAMRLRAQIYNDGCRQAGHGWMSCLPGWEVMSEDGKIFRLCHQTATGRLTVSGGYDSVEVFFSSGESLPEGIERDSDFYPTLPWEMDRSHIFCHLRLTPRKGQVDVAICYAYPEMFSGRPDRLGLLWEIDEKLGGEISRSLRETAMPSRWGQEAQERAKAILATVPQVEEVVVV